MRFLIKEFLNNFDPGKPSLTVLKLPTGYGKTELFIELANKVGKELERAIYVSPLRTLNEDLYKKLLEKSSCNKDSIARQYMERHESPFFNKPIIITTIDTLGLHIHKLPPPELGSMLKGFANNELLTRGHYQISRGNIADSLIFIDEPHLMIVENGLKTLFYNSLFYLLSSLSTVILASATITTNMLNEVKKILFEAQNRVGEKIEYKECLYGEKCDFSEAYTDEDFDEKAKEKNVSIKIKSEPFEKVVEEIVGRTDKRRILIIVNTRGKAIKIYKNLVSNHPQTYMLHGLLSTKDRESMLNDILKNKRQGYLVIATQVVEAGVDISSEIMITEAAPIQSLIQRFGRLARWDDEKEGEAIIVYNDSEKQYYPYNVEEVTITLNFLKEKLENIKIKVPISHNSHIGYMQLANEVENKLKEASQKRGDRIFPEAKILAVSPIEQEINVAKLLTGNLGRNILGIKAVIMDRWNEFIHIPLYLIEKIKQAELLDEIVQINTSDGQKTGEEKSSLLSKLIEKVEMVEKSHDENRKSRFLLELNMFIIKNSIDCIVISEKLYNKLAYEGGLE